MSKADFCTRDTHLYMLCGWHTRSDIPLTNVPTIEHSHEDIDIHVQIAPGNSPISKNVHRDEHWAERSLIRIKRVADFEVSTKNRNPCLLQRIFSPVSLNNTGAYWRGRKRVECGFARNPPA